MESGGRAKDEDGGRGKGWRVGGRQRMRMGKR